MQKAYLQVRLDVKVFPPIVVGVDISSQSASEMAFGVYADLLSVEADTFHNAVEEIRKIVPLELFKARYAFVEKFLEDKSYCRQEADLAKAAVAFAEAIRKSVG